MFRSPDRLLDDATASALVALGGYVHPLFTDERFLAASPFDARPLPGQGLLLVMGGLAEQSGAYGPSTVALLGFEHVGFRHPACAGDTVHVEVRALPAESERVARSSWRCVRADATVLAEATARFLVRPDAGA